MLVSFFTLCNGRFSACLLESMLIGPDKPAMAYETRPVQASDITMLDASFCILTTNLMDIILAFIEVILYGNKEL